MGGGSIVDLILDFFANVTGKFNTLLLVPVFIGMALYIAAIILGLTKFPPDCCKRNRQTQMDHSYSKRRFTQILPKGSERWGCGPRYFWELLKGRSDADDAIDPVAFSKNYTDMILVGALFLSVSVNFFSKIPVDRDLVDQQIHGIVWCSAIYLFWGCTVLSVVYTQATNSFLTEYHLVWWIKKMGQNALMLPTIFAMLGFALVFYGTTQFFVNHFYSAGGKSGDFSICAGVCYGIVPFLAYPFFKMRHARNAVNDLKNNLHPLDLKDIDECFYLYLNQLVESPPDTSYLDADFDDFMQYTTRRQLYAEDDSLRGGVLIGMRRDYARRLFDEFIELHRYDHEMKARRAAGHIFQRLNGMAPQSPSAAHRHAGTYQKIYDPQASPRSPRWQGTHSARELLTDYKFDGLSTSPVSTHLEPPIEKSFEHLIGREEEDLEDYTTSFSYQPSSSLKPSTATRPSPQGGKPVQSQLSAASKKKHKGSTSRSAPAVSASSAAASKDNALRQAVLF